MGFIIVLTPIVIGSWPVISAAVTAAAVGLGLNEGETGDFTSDFAAQGKITFTF